MRSEDDIYVHDADGPFGKGPILCPPSKLRDINVQPALTVATEFHRLEARRRARRRRVETCSHISELGCRPWKTRICTISFIIVCRDGLWERCASRSLPLLLLLLLPLLRSACFPSPKTKRFGLPHYFHFSLKQAASIAFILDTTPCKLLLLLLLRYSLRTVASVGATSVTTVLFLQEQKITRARELLSSPFRAKTGGVGNVAHIETILPRASSSNVKDTYIL